MRKAKGLFLVAVAGIAPTADARDSRDSEPEEEQARRPAGPPRLAVVSLGDQRVTVEVRTDDLQPIRREESTRVFGDD